MGNKAEKIVEGGMGMTWKIFEKKNKCEKKKMPQEKINKFVAENGTRRLIVGWRMKKVEKFGI